MKICLLSRLINSISAIIFHSPIVVFEGFLNDAHWIWGRIVLVCQGAICVPFNKCLCAILVIAYLFQMYDVKRDGDAVSVLGLERLGLLNIPTYLVPWSYVCTCIFSYSSITALAQFWWIFLFASPFYQSYFPNLLVLKSEQ